ncbi:Pyridoxal phosphate-dependent transferase major region subdomain 1 [Penicillium expansum]|nr:Pyridoxal phosphate-dependent transferase major region subdomain 1 [Penicillium expansum]
MPLSISDIESLRAASTPLPTTISARVSSDSFKSPEAHSKPTSRELKGVFSEESRHFGGSALRQSASTTGNHDLIALGTGRPTADYYPWNSITFNGISPEFGNNVGTNSQTVNKLDDIYNLSTALNYGYSAGSPPLVRFFTEHTEIVHDPPYSDWRVFLSCGSTAAFEVAFRIFCDRGDTLLTEEYTYPGALEAAALIGIKSRGIPMDAQGPIPEELERVLSTWDDLSSQSPKPKAFYTVPSGQNPTGATQSLERKLAIYDIAERHNLIIIEDDPYYFLRLGGDYRPSRSNEPAENGNKAGEGNSASKFLASLIPSYLSIDRTGRVVRLDSTSKILAPGLRAGWVTASAQIINKFIAYQEVSTIAVSGPSQLMLWKLVEQSWGHEGFFKWLGSLSQRYCERLNILLKACNQYLPKEICSWVSPDYGMFFWIKVDWHKHPFVQQNEQTNTRLQILDVEDRVVKAAFKDGVQVTKGSFFSVNKHNDGLHFRITFAAASEKDLDAGVRIFANALRKEFSLGSC